MLKKTLLVLLFASASLAAHAAPSGWYFSYTGLLDEDMGVWNPDRQIDGIFFGEDLNHDQVIDMRELTQFTMFGLELLDCSERYVCSVNSFSFGPDNALQFSTSYRDKWGGLSASQRGYSQNLDRPPYSHFYAVTDQTKFSISTAVPEPATYAMMGVGLLGLALLQRRRKPSQSPA